jgi:hypothetical protein
LGEAQTSKKIIHALIPPFFGGEAAVLSLKFFMNH